jgi:hypothetical protein
MVKVIGGGLIGDVRYRKVERGGKKIIKVVLRSD